MRMERRFVARRRASAIIVGILLIALFTYVTRDTCYVGEGGNALGYGSCSKMLDEIGGK